MKPGWTMAAAAMRTLMGRLSSPDGSALLAIVFVAFLGHGLWLINDALVCEDWIWYAWARELRLDIMWVDCAWSNAHAQFLPFALLSVFPDIVLGARITTFLLVVIVGVFVYLIGSRHTVLGSTEAVWVALLSITYPANMVTHCFGLIAYPFYFAVFLGASLLSLEAETKSARLHIWLRVLAVAMFFLSFGVGSLIVFYGVFLAIHFCRYRSLEGSASAAPPVWQSMCAYLRCRADFVALPALFWLARHMNGQFFAVNTRYNSLGLDSSTIMLHVWAFVDVIRRQLQLLAHVSVLHLRIRVFLMGLLAVAGLTLLLLWWQKSRRLAHAGRPARTYVQIFVFGFFSLMCGVLPYVLVGKSPGPDRDDLLDWPSRWTMLVALPMAVILVASVALTTRATGLAPRWRFVFLGLLVCSGCWVQNENCIRLQCLGIRFWSMAMALQEADGAGDVHVWQAADGTRAFGRLPLPDYCRPFFMQYIFGGDTHRYVIDALPPRSGSVVCSTNPYDVAVARWKKFQDEGWFCGYCMPSAAAPLGNIAIAHGPIVSKWKLVSRYWYLKFFDRPGVPEFLRQALRITITVGRPAMESL